ncbi:MAG: hypothetical protein C4320_07730 [Armatimonadota bacterium]
MLPPSPIGSEERREVRRQYAIGCAILLGFFMTVVGGWLSYVLMVGGVGQAIQGGGQSSARSGGDLIMNSLAFMIAMVLIGVLLLVGGLIFGLAAVRKENTGPRRQVEGAFVVARYVVAPGDLYLTSPHDIQEVEHPQYFVRLNVPGEGSVEFTTSAETFWWAGEGMRGSAELSGRWLGRFTPDIGQQAPPDPGP